MARNIGAHHIKRFGAGAGGIRSHIGNQAHAALTGQVHTFVQRLSIAHNALRGIA